MPRKRKRKSNIPKDSFSDDKLKEFIESEYPEIGEVMIPLGLAEAFVGFCTSEREHPCLVYDASKIIDVLMNRDEMTRDEAIEFFEYNIEAVKSSDQNHPLYIWSIPKDWSRD